MIVPNINCKHYDGYGFCMKMKRIWGWFRRECVEIDLNTKCPIAERYVVVEKSYRHKDESEGY
jgi:hypothetical protein